MHKLNKLIQTLIGNYIYCLLANRKIMTEKDILKLVEETFSEEISTSCTETVLGLESWIDGKEAFMEKLTEKLKLLFYENDLSK